jgi:BolA protein
MQTQTAIQEKLTNALAPVHLEVINESHGHNVPAGSETHFKIVAVSEAFTGENPVKRHRRVYGVLENELANGVHALSLHLYAPDEWSDAEVPNSPRCLGGGKK